MRLEGKKAIVTGGGRGIGRAYVERFLREGAEVVVADLDEKSATQTVEDLSSLGTVSFIKADVADVESVRSFVDEAAEIMGGIDVLVNNAALFGDMTMDNQEYDYLKKVFEVNLHSVWLVSRAAAPHLVKSSAGSIINQSSGSAWNYSFLGPKDGDFTELYSYAYPITKHGVVGLTKYMANQLGNWGVTVNAIAPGPVHTEAFKSSVAPEFAKKLVESQPIQKPLMPEDLTGTVVFFASDDARMVTGQVVVVDGGRHMPA